MSSGVKECFYKVRQLTAVMVGLIAWFGNALGWGQNFVSKAVPADVGLLTAGNKHTVKES